MPNLPPGAYVFLVYLLWGLFKWVRTQWHYRSALRKAEKDFANVNPSPNKSRRKNKIFIYLPVYAILTAISAAFTIVAQKYFSSNIPSNSIQNQNNKYSTPQIVTRSSSERAESPGYFDPAVGIRPYISIYNSTKYPHLNNEDEYRKTLGDLARIQERMLVNQSQSRNYPQIIIGPGKFTGQCDIGRETVGTYFYGNSCNVIQINFETDQIAYEKSIEVATTLAHEYAHHLTQITIGLKSISGLEAELIADCFAGMLYGYWDKYGKVNKEEIEDIAKMMIQVSKQEQLDTSAMHGDPGQRVGAFMGGAYRALGQETVQYGNFCRGLDRIIDWSKGLP